MLMHVYLRTKSLKVWDKLYVAGCDKEILNYCNSFNIPYITTSKNTNDVLIESLKQQIKS